MVAEEVEFHNGELQFVGTLYLPEAAALIPAMVVLLSKMAISSDWVHNEIRFAQMSDTPLIVAQLERMTFRRNWKKLGLSIFPRAARRRELSSSFATARF